MGLVHIAGYSPHIAWAQTSTAEMTRNLAHSPGTVPGRTHPGTSDPAVGSENLDPDFAAGRNCNLDSFGYNLAGSLRPHLHTNPPVHRNIDLYILLPHVDTG